MESVVCLQIKMSIPDDKKISIASITNAIEDQGLENQATKLLLEELQRQEVYRLCGRKNLRKNQDKPCQRRGYTPRTVSTKFGKIKLKLARVMDRATGRTFKPLKDRIDLKGKKVYQDDISILSVEFSTKMTYRDASKEVERVVRESPSPSTINRRAREYGSAIIDFNREATKGDIFNLVMADGTKVHGIKGKKNEVNVILGLEDNGNKRLLGATVNRSWYSSARDIKDWIDSKAVLISDAEKEIRYAILKKDMKFQLDVVHVPKEVGYKLWQDSVPKEERDGILGELKAMLYTLKNSVEKHAKDGDMERLKHRVNLTLKGLKELADRVGRMGCFRAAKFIRNSANYMVTYALLLIKGIKVPWNSNVIERLMGEIAKRVKNKWMHWSTKGLEALINLILVRYTCEDTYEEFYRKVQGLEGLKFISMEMKVYAKSAVS
ncbi:MAG: transposase [Candidatus Hydrothermarchaeota archaeon]